MSSQITGSVIRSALELLCKSILVGCATIGGTIGSTYAYCNNKDVLLYGIGGTVIGALTPIVIVETFIIADKLRSEFI